MPRTVDEADAVRLQSIEHLTQPRNFVCLYQVASANASIEFTQYVFPAYSLRCAIDVNQGILSLLLEAQLPTLNIDQVGFFIRLFGKGG